MNRYRIHVLTILLAFGTLACEQSEPDQIVDAVLVGDAEGSIPVLDPPFEASEIEARVADFDWAHTEPLPVLDEDGRPALHYALVLLRDREDLEELGIMEIHHDALPLFEVEHARWSGQAGVHHFPGSDEGDLAFAILPAELYNLFRESALEGEPIFDAVFLEEVPEPDARLPGGSIDYEWMVAHGFDYGSSEAATGSGTDVGSRSEPLFGRIVRAARRTARRIINGVREAAGEVREALGGSRTFSMKLVVRNTDSRFDPGSPLRQAWGDDSGERIEVDGLEVLVASGVMISLERGYTDHNSFVRMSVPTAGRIRVHVRLKNAAADLIGLLWDSRITVYHGDVDREGWVHLHADVQHSDMNAIAQMTDARRFVRDVLDYESPRRLRSHSPVFTKNMPTALVRTGAIATGVLPNASAPCLGFFGFGTFSFGDGRGWSVPANLVSLFDEADIWLPADSASRRVTPTHEYAHFVQCAFLADHSRRAFGRAWSAVWQDSLLQDGPTDGEAGIIAEAWADFLSNRIAGGILYYNPGNAVSANGTAYCNPALDARESPCIEDNVGGVPGEWPRGQLATPTTDRRQFEIGRMMTLLSDAFDGPGSQMHAGSAWELTPDPADPVVKRARFRRGNHAHDEAVSLPGNALVDIIDSWADHSNRLTFGSFLDATARVMLAHGATEEEVCTLFALHSPSYSCADLIDTERVFDDVIPLSPPVDLRVHSEHPVRTDPPVATLELYDLNPLGDEMEIGWRVPGEPLLGGTRRVPHSLTLEEGFSSLPFDTPVTFTAQAVQDGRVGPIAEVSERTPAEPVAELSGVGEPGAVSLEWPAAVASSYAVSMLAPEEREIARTSSPGFYVRGLAGETDHTFQVVSINADGRLSAHASPPVTVRTAPALDLYVSQSSGDDSNPLAGAPDTPFATIAAALATVGTEPTTLHVAGGDYVEPALAITDRDVTIRGGYEVSGSTWTDVGALTRILPGVDSGARTVPAHGRFNLASWRADASIAVRGGALTMHGLRIEPTGSSGARCVAALWAEDAEVVLDGVRLEVTESPSCAIGVYVGGATSRAAISNSEIVGYQNPGSLGDVDVAGLLTWGTAEVTIADSTIIGIDALPDSTRGGSVASTMGWIDGGSASLRAARSTFRSVRARSLFLLSSGYSSAADLGGDGSISIDNSVLTTPQGGTITDTLRVRGTGSTGSVVHLVHNTLVHGDRHQPDAAVRPARGTRASLLSLEGRVRTLWLVNDLFVFGDFGTWTERAPALDFRRLSGDVPHAGSIVRGNIVSYPPTLAFGSGGDFFAACEITGSEFDPIAATETSLNLERVYSCRNGGTLDVRDNVALWAPADDGPASERRTVVVDTDGRHVAPTGPGTMSLLQTTGIPLDPPLSGTSLRRDRGGTDRPDLSMPGVGAWAP